MKKSIQAWFLFILFIAGTQFASAQLSGKILDREDATPLEYATVALYTQTPKKLITGVITNQKGVFTFDKIKKGTYIIEVSFIGYQPKKIENIVYSGNAKDLGNLKISLGNSLNEVVIKAERAAIVSKIDKQIFDATNFQNSQGGTGTDVIRNLPSVSVNGIGEISVRGTTGFVVLLNGNPVQGNASTILNQLPANAIDKVEVITAPSAKYDPEGKAGIINIFTKKGALNGTFTQINTRIGAPSIENYNNSEAAKRYGVDATFNYRKDQWNVSLGASYQRNDLAGRREGDVFTIIKDVKTSFPSDGERSFDEENYSGRFTIDYTPNKNNEFSIGFFAGKRSKDRRADIVYFDNNAVQPADSDNRLYTFQYFNENLRIRKSDFALGSFDYAHTFRDDSKLSTSFLYEYTFLGGPTTNRNLGFPDTSQIIQDEYNTNDNPLNGTLLRVDYEFADFSFGKLETGYQYRFLNHEGDFLYTRRNNTSGFFETVPEFTSQIDLKRTLHSGYVNVSGKKEQWEYVAGIRLEKMDRELTLQGENEPNPEVIPYDYLQLFPSATLQYTLKNKAQLKMAYSRRVQRTTTFKMNPFREREHSETLEQGDKNLLPEFVDLVEIGISKRYKKGNSVYATAYLRNVKNLVNRVNKVFNDTILDRIYTNVGQGKSLGLELGAQLKPTENWRNFIGVNIFNLDINGDFVYEENGTTFTKKIDNNATQYTINFNSTYQFNTTSSLQFTLNYLSKRVTAQGEDSRFYSPNLTFQKTFFDNRLSATLQWQNIDLGLLDTNEQRITTAQQGSFFTTTNYVYEVDMVTLNLSYNLNSNKNKSKFIESEFGAKEF
ncbi:MULTISPECIES: outer membrane beta-barrel protein [unclassified Polaribacter]|uniref:outer membrane beta-barrel protein n=1 Tax=unclassified Polaribacter TaxID=196858 RepID=UPI0011BF88FB|nr:MULTISPECIES: outer membrane beta-barrel protein [unclassified Polaribacter]TXD54129.1 outer membrane beta-barrel protein [Polaribacter sp. IC063]TXD62394.1 outer membrane beta-barrel protein [Polaribacter sp. IC066]